jgi:hypothetical protein
MINRKTQTENESMWQNPENNQKYFRDWQSEKVVEIIENVNIMLKT